MTGFDTHVARIAESYQVLGCMRQYVIFIFAAFVAETSEWNDVMDGELFSIIGLGNPAVAALIAVALAYCFGDTKPFRAVIRQSSAPPTGMFLAMDIMTSPRAEAFTITELKLIITQAVRLSYKSSTTIRTVYFYAVVLWMIFADWITAFSAPLTIAFTRAKMMFCFYSCRAWKLLKRLTAIFTNQIQWIGRSIQAIVFIPASARTKLLFIMPVIIKYFPAYHADLDPHNKNLQWYCRCLVQGAPITTGGKYYYIKHQQLAVLPEQSNYIIFGGALSQ